MNGLGNLNDFSVKLLRIIYHTYLRIKSFYFLFIYYIFKHWVFLSYLDSVLNFILANIRLGPALSECLGRKCKTVMYY